jgi:hypothetical protein
MCSEPAWLPVKAQVDPWSYGAGQDTYEILYEIFRRDFVISKPRYLAREIWYFGVIEDGKEAIFWHLTTRNIKKKPLPRRMRGVVEEIPVEEERYPDLRRSERLPWIRPLIENSVQPEVLAWDYKEGDGNIHVYIWIKSGDFVVIMKKYPDNRCRLVTSYFVDNDYTKSDFERKYKNRQP